MRKIHLLVAITLFAATGHALAAPLTPLEAGHLARHVDRGFVVERAESSAGALTLHGTLRGAPAHATVDTKAARVLRIVEDGETVYEWPGVLAVAHRGTVTMAPENTIAAIEAAIEAGAHAIEIDIRQTKDGHLVLMHDRTVDRTTDGTGPIAEMTLAEVRQLDAGAWFGSGFDGERVPTLAEALEAMKGRAMPDLDFKAGDPVALVTLVREQGLIGQSTLYAGDWDLLRQVREVAPDLRVRPTLRNRWGMPVVVSTFDPPLVNLGWDKTHRDTIRDIHLGGKLAFVNLLGSNDNAWAAGAAIDAGADYIQTDHIGMLVDVLKQRGVYAQVDFAPETHGESADGLAGTTWKARGYTLVFKEDNVVFVKGPELPDGMDGRYKVEDGKFRLDVAGTYRLGTFDGETLIIDGATAEKR